MTRPTGPGRFWELVEGSVMKYRKLARSGSNRLVRSGRRPALPLPPGLRFQAVNAAGLAAGSGSTPPLAPDARRRRLDELTTGT